MTLKRSFGLSATFIILLSSIVVFSYTYMMFQLSKAQDNENRLAEHNKSINKGTLELNVWLDQMEQHVIEGWPFEGELNHQHTSHVYFLDSYEAQHEDEKKILSELSHNHSMLHKTAVKIVETSDEEKKMDIYLDEFKQYSNAVSPLIGGISNLLQSKLLQIRNERISLQNKTGYFIVVSSILTIIAIVAAIILLFRKVLNPISNVSDKISLFGDGNLDVSVDYQSNNEIGDIARNFNKMVLSFNNLIGGILESSEKVVSSVDVLQQRAGETSMGAQKQKLQSEQAATASEEMNQTIMDIAKSAAVASDTSGETMKIAEDGKKVSEGAIDTVNSVHRSSLDLSEMVEKLNNRVSEIGDILTIINDIADQTNLLALNAAIEAARAGEQGRGFAVVADEVRKLAERTMSATSEISEKISLVQTESEQTNESMEEASNKVKKATEYIENVGSSLLNIVESVQIGRGQVTQIATAVDEQSAASEQVTRNIEQTSDIAKSLEKMSDEVMREVNKLSDIADELKNYTTGFRKDSHSAYDSKTPKSGIEPTLNI